MADIEPQLSRAQIRPFPPLEPGSKVRITQFIRHGHKDALWPTEILGEVIAQQDRCTGSWFAHSPTHRVILHRLLIRKPDGEESLVSVDERTKITVLELPAKS